MSAADLESDFRAAIATAGLTPPERVEADGKLHRFATNGKRDDDSGWYVLHSDGVAAGAFGCWREGVQQTWRADIGRKLTPAEKTAHRNRVKVMRQARELEAQSRHAQARDRAASIWKQSTPVGDHPYLLAKKIKAHGTHFYNGALVIPIRDLEGTLHSLEFISAEGDKKFLTGGKVAGNHYLIGSAGDPIYIAEGFATGASIHQATGHGVAVAFSAGNLQPVARAFRTKYPHSKIIMAGDNDESGTGQAKAAAAAKAVGGVAVVPAESGTDWNDIASQHDAEELRRRIEDVPPTDEGEPLPPEYSDDALASEFTRQHANELRYVAPWGKWLRWDNNRWAEDRITSVFDMVRTVCRDTSAGANDERIARQLASAKTVAAVERLARSDPRHAALPEGFDADDFLLNTPGGTVDLRTGKTRAHRREDLLTKITSVAADLHAPDSTWRQFLAEISCDDLDLQEYLQRLVGYCLTGDVRDHVLPFFHGSGANGKSTLLDLLLFIMGDYAKQVPSETLTEARGERHPTDVANLLGLRLAVSSELEEGQHWAEARVKSLTGDANLTGRFMRMDFFEFRRTHKHVIAGNHRPAIRVVDEAMRRRIHLVPFNARFDAERADREMPIKLQAEAPAVLAWAIQGCLEWRRLGLNPPAIVMGATDDYLASQDSLGMWLSERCDTRDQYAETRSGALYENFREWKERRGEKSPSQMRFSGQLESRFRKSKTGYGFMVFHGVRLKW